MLLLRLLEFFAQLFQLLGIILVTFALFCINLPARRIITSGLAASVVELTLGQSAGGVFRTVSLWMEEFTQITFLTRRKIKAISAVVELATLIKVEATRTVPTFFVGRFFMTFVYAGDMHFIRSHRKLHFVAADVAAVQLADALLSRDLGFEF